MTLENLTQNTENVPNQGSSIYQRIAQTAALVAAMAMPIAYTGCEKPTNEPNADYKVDEKRLEEALEAIQKSDASEKEKKSLVAIYKDPVKALNHFSEEQKETIKNLEFKNLSQKEKDYIVRECPWVDTKNPKLSDRIVIRAYTAFGKY